jgi:hypothetical protein
MKTKNQLLLIMTSSLIPTGCTTASHVAIARPEEVKGYPAVGSVRSTFPFGGIFKNFTYSLALDNALKKAEKMGATHFVPDEGSGPAFFAISETASGTAYRQQLATPAVRAPSARLH